MKKPNTKRIKKGLIDKGIPARRIAEMLDVGDSAVSMVIRGESTSRRIEDKIAELLDVPVARLFPYRSSKTV